MTQENNQIDDGEVIDLCWIAVSSLQPEDFDHHGAMILHSLLMK